MPNILWRITIIQRHNYNYTIIYVPINLHKMNEQPMVAVGNATVESHAVVVETSGARLTEFAVLSELRDYYLEGSREGGVTVSV